MTHSEPLPLSQISIDQLVEDPEENIKINSTHERNIVRSKKIHKLEKNLMSALLDPVDSDSRKRHVKRLIYGESVDLDD